MSLSFLGELLSEEDSKRAWAKRDGLEQSKPAPVNKKNTLAFSVTVFEIDGLVPNVVDRNLCVWTLQSFLLNSEFKRDKPDRILGELSLSRNWILDTNWLKMRYFTQTYLH